MAGRVSVPTFPTALHPTDPRIMARLVDHVSGLTQSMHEFSGELAETRGHVLGTKAEVERIAKALGRDVHRVKRELDDFKDDSKVHQIEELKRQLAERKRSERWWTQKGWSVAVAVGLALAGFAAAEIFQVLAHGHL